MYHIVTWKVSTGAVKTDPKMPGGKMPGGKMASIPPVSCSSTEQIFDTKELQWTDAAGKKHKHEVRFLVPNGTTSEDESGYIMRLFSAPCPVEEGVPGQSGTAPRA